MEDQKNWAKCHYLDASALVKLYVEEQGSHELRAFFNARPNMFATQLCFAEALGILKNKAKYEHISQEAYFQACHDLAINAWGGRIELEDISLANPDVFDRVQAIARSHNLDLADALQLFTISTGKNSVLGPNSASVLISADAGLVSAARKVGIRAWNCATEELPAWA